MPLCIKYLGYKLYLAAYAATLATRHAPPHYDNILAGLQASDKTVYMQFELPRAFARRLFSAQTVLLSRMFSRQSITKVFYDVALT